MDGWVSERLHQDGPAKQKDYVRYGRPAESRRGGCWGHKLILSWWH